MPEQIVRADVDGDESDIPRVPMDEREGRVQLRARGVSTRGMLPRDERATRLTDARHVVQSKTAQTPGEGPVDIVNVALVREALPRLIAGRERIPEGQVVRSAAPDGGGFGGRDLRCGRRHVEYGVDD